MRPLRILIFVQALSGVGHFVRMLQIGRALAAMHQVHMFDGGVPVPRATLDEVRLVTLPRLRRVAGQLQPLQAGTTLATVHHERLLRLADQARQLRPDVLLVEHYPFSKWELQSEVDCLRQASRSVNPACLVLCSLRDIAPQTRHEQCAPVDYQHRVLERLHADFDGLMVHGDERFTPLSASFPLAHELRLPICHTGVVSESWTPDDDCAERIRACTDGAPYLLVSSGGGTSLPLAELALHAWSLLQRAEPALRDWKMVICTGLGQAGAEVTTLRCGGGPSAAVLPFDPHFPQWLQGCALSLSAAGYNTCAGLLAARRPALVIPDPGMSDQTGRAQLLAAHGAVRTLQLQDASDPHLLSRALRHALDPLRPVKLPSIDGASRSCAWIEHRVRAAA